MYKHIMSALILLQIIDDFIFYLKKTFLSVYLIVLLTIVSGKGTVIQNKLIICIQQPIINLRETLLHFDTCAGIEFKHCYQDDVSGSNSGTVSLLWDSCGFIDSQKVNTYRYTWRITSRQTVWIHILKFNIYFVDFPCNVEYMTIEDTNIQSLFCGSRVPWKYYSINSIVFVMFISDIHLPNKGEFQLFFQEGMKVWHSKYINQVTLTAQRHIFHYAERDETQFLYFIAHRLHIIHLNISSRWSSSHMVIHDGPGIKSPLKRTSTNVTSSAFILLVVVTTKDSNALLTDYQPYLIRYKSTYNEIKRCMETSHSEMIRISIKNNFLGTERCTWKVPSNIRMLIIDDKGAVERPETLLDDEHCIYGGIYIYSTSNGVEWQEVYSKCRKGITEFEFIPERNTNTMITAVVFYPYSNIIHQDFIHFVSWKWTISMDKYKTRIGNCSMEKVCESRIKFPAHVISFPHFFTDDNLYTQYIGDSDVSTRLKFSQQLTPAYTAYFASSLCRTPPHYCTCIKLGVQYSNPVSYFVPEANRAEHFFTTNKGFYEADIHFASSLSINMSACEARNYKIWWMLIFSKWKYIYEYEFKTTNTSFPLLINDRISHSLQLDALLTEPTAWWFLLHIIENTPSSDQHTDIASKVCIHCLLCHNIQLNVEVLQQGKDESIVYSLSNHRLIHSINYKYRPFEPECITGITCTTCNIILTYQGSLSQNQNEGCGGCKYSELGVFVRTFTREKESTSTTSVKGNQITKISTR